MRALLLLALPLFAQIPDPPGRLFDIGGRKLHMHCTGSGAPAVILEAGASSFSIDWSLVQPEIADAGHEIHLFKPGAVIEASREVITLAAKK